jgi:hypothetical protein
VTLSVRGASRRLARCRDLKLVTEGTSWNAADVRYGAKPGTYTVIEVLRGAMSSLALGAAAETDRRAWVEACGETWDLGKPELEQIYELQRIWAGMAKGPQEPLELDGVQDNRGRLSTRLVLSRQATLRLEGRPTQDGRQLVATLLWFAAQPELQDCHDVRVMAEGQAVSVRGVRRAKRERGTLNVEILRGHLDARSALLLGEAQGPAVLSACGRELEISDGQREWVHNLFQMFFARAKAAGSWDDEATQEGEDASTSKRAGQRVARRHRDWTPETP